jgi:YhcH/YjgK/YiaL family protein
MIFDHIDNAALYLGLSPNLAEGLHFLTGSDLSQFAPGKHEIPGKDFYILAQAYETKPLEKGVWEAHRKYIDIQYVLEGVEHVGCSPILQMTSGTYDEGRDFISFTGSGDFLTLGTGYFAIFMPQDAHMPGLRVDDARPEAVKKVVLKVAVRPLLE